MTNTDNSLGQIHSSHVSKRGKIREIFLDKEPEGRTEISIAQEDPTKDQKEDAWNASQETVEDIAELSIVQAEAQIVEVTEEMMDVSQAARYITAQSASVVWKSLCYNFNGGNDLAFY